MSQAPISTSAFPFIPARPQEPRNRSPTWRYSRGLPFYYRGVVGPFNQYVIQLSQLIALIYSLSKESEQMHWKER